jgi:hypothetical protein
MIKTPIALPKIVTYLSAQIEHVLIRENGEEILKIGLEQKKLAFLSTK